MTTKRRTYKVGEKLHEILAKEFQKVGDPRFSMVTISSVQMSTDLRYAKVYWLASGDKERLSEIDEAFEHAQSRFKKIIAAQLGVRFVPEIRFFYDDTFDAADEIEALLARARKA